MVTDRTRGNPREGAGVERRSPRPTDELEQLGGKGTLTPGYARGGSAKHFHVHKHYYTGGKVRTESKRYGTSKKRHPSAQAQADAERRAEATVAPQPQPLLPQNGSPQQPYMARGGRVRKARGGKVGRGFKPTGGRRHATLKGTHDHTDATPVRDWKMSAPWSRDSGTSGTRNRLATGGTINRLARGGKTAVRVRQPPAKSAGMGTGSTRNRKAAGGALYRGGGALGRLKGEEC
jgi:hypothetical protein